MHYNPQQTKIIELCKSGEWVCQKYFQPISWCAHKRRAEIEKKGEYKFEKRPCECPVQISGSNDWIMSKIQVEVRPEKKEERVGLFPSYPKVDKDFSIWRQ